MSWKNIKLSSKKAYNSKRFFINNKENFNVLYVYKKRNSKTRLQDNNINIYRKKFNLNGVFKRFTYKEYKNMEINLIKNSNNNIKIEEIDELI